jgi:hypothetical protein
MITKIDLILKNYKYFSKSKFATFVFRFSYRIIAMQNKTAKI